MSQPRDINHAFKGTRFPWTPERMEFILNELITRHNKYKTYAKLIDVYIILAEKIGATPRIVENFIKNLGRDYREWMKVHPNCDRNKMKLRGSNNVFKMFEEYNRIYLNEDPPNFPLPKLMEYSLDEQDRLVHIPEGEDEDDDSPQYIEVIDADMKEEPRDQEEEDSLQITSVMSMSSQARCTGNTNSDPPSPTPPPPPLPRVPKPQGRRSMVTIQAPPSASALRQHEPVGLQDVVMIPTDRAHAPQLKHVTPRSSGPSSTTHGHVQSPVATNVHASVANQGLLSTISSLPSLVQHPQFHLPQGSASSPGVGSHYIPLHVIQNGSTPHATYTEASVPYEGMPSSNPGTSHKRPMKTPHDAPQHSSKKSRTSNVPLVAENLPEGMSEFENRYLQALDTQNKMLSDIGRELKLLRTGFFAIHSDEIADMVNPNMR
ncbi:uncharacterized protein LOC115918962 [Strongylocentrotus purpuratus]|uniref:Uncharacterized protein n=1 Tax=Strongylocentrotus purpuratus TaxID=7668 RepID=A0A7M7PI77_STRPU|nr:uncharacterized protein LOC115918962 [Strongylocentrotus purpuratus]|eukprot:XP_799972.1 PREDICTED: uncharacterized protein LOC577814 [Strongylocentrotus purpuratus]